MIILADVKQTRSTDYAGTEIPSTDSDKSSVSLVKIDNEEPYMLEDVAPCANVVIRESDGQSSSSSTPSVTTKATISSHVGSPAVPVLKSFLAGSLSGTCSALLFQPLDLVKTRIQSSGKGHTGIISVVVNVLKQESIPGLWRGLVPTITRCVPGVGIYFSLVHTLKTNLGSSSPSPLESLLIGAAARGTAATIMHPISVLKTRYESGMYNYKSISRSLFVIYSTEGKAGLFSGLAPTIARDVPFSALYFMFYSEIRSVLPYDKFDDRYVPLIHFNSGIVAGLLASFLTQPADVMKTHMQLNPQKHTHVKDVIGFIYRRDGLLGFQRGFLPRALRRCLMSAMAWTVYEQMMKGFGLTI